MLTDEQIATAVSKIEARYQKIVEKYLQKVGKTINQIGHLTQSNINLLVQLQRMGVSAGEIERELQKCTNLSQMDIKSLYQKAIEEAYTDARFMYITKGINPSKDRFDTLLEAMWRQTAQQMQNLSNTTAIAEPYRKAIDEAVQAVSMGATDYNSAIRDAVKQIGRAGLQVEYESGYHKRLDTAVRQNVLDGVRQIQQEAQRMIGEEIGADGVDITAHPNSAPDHEPVQGRRFDLANFQRMQSGQTFEDVDGKRYLGFERPITQWHCRHLIHYIILGISRRMYTDKQLKEWEANNRKGCMIDSKHYTNYEATQLMCRLETEIRRQKDTAILAKASGDDVLRRECQGNITKLTAKYNAVADAAGLRKRMDKTRVEGFKPLRETVFMNPPKDLKELSKAVDKELDNYCERKSKWSGNTIVRTREEMPRATGRKEWNCDVSLRDTAGVKTAVHEHLHARSVSYHDEKTYIRNQNAEEGSVELFAQEICKKNGVPFSEAYKKSVKPLCIINNILRNGKRYEFAKQLFDISLPERYNWLRSQADWLISTGKLKKRTVDSLNEAVEYFHEKDVR